MSRRVEPSIALFGYRCGELESVHAWQWLIMLSGGTGEGTADKAGGVGGRGDDLWAWGRGTGCVL